VISIGWLCMKLLTADEDFEAILPKKEGALRRPLEARCASYHGAQHLLRLTRPCSAETSSLAFVHKLFA
jgi:hypothetical protein